MWIPVISALAPLFAQNGGVFRCRGGVFSKYAYSWN